MQVFGKGIAFLMYKQVMPSKFQHLAIKNVFCLEGGSVFVAAMSMNHTIPLLVQV